MIVRCVWEHNGNDTILYSDNFVGAFTRGASLQEAEQKMPEEIRRYQISSACRVSCLCPILKNPKAAKHRKITFDKICRTLLLDISKKHGLNIDVEPEFGGREYLEKQDYILMKQAEKIEKQEQRLEKLEVTIADTEAFAEKVSDIAYEKVVEETRNAGFEMIADFKKDLMSPNNPNTNQVKNLGGKILDALMYQFEGLTRKITEELIRIFFSLRKVFAGFVELVSDPIAEATIYSRSSKRTSSFQMRRVRLSGYFVFENMLKSDNEYQWRSSNVSISV